MNRKIQSLIIRNEKNKTLTLSSYQSVQHRLLFLTFKISTLKEWQVPTSITKNFRVDKISQKLSKYR